MAHAWIIFINTSYKQKTPSDLWLQASCAMLTVVSTLRTSSWYLTRRSCNACTRCLLAASRQNPQVAQPWQPLWTSAFQMWRAKMCWWWSLGETHLLKSCVSFFPADWSCLQHTTSLFVFIFFEGTGVGGCWGGGERRGVLFEMKLSSSSLNIRGQLVDFYWHIYSYFNSTILLWLLQVWSTILLLEATPRNML